MMTIHSKIRETIIQAVKRAQDNAQVYSRIVTLNYQGITSLVYPQDNYQAILPIKIGLLTRQIAELS